MEDVRRPRALAPGLAFALAMLAAACGDTAHRPAPAAAPQSGLPAALPAPVASLAELEAAGRAPVELAAAPVDGYSTLPTYAAKVRNACDRPVRRVVATVVYLDATGRAMPGENHDVAFGSPLKAIDPGVTLETAFLSRVDRAPGVRLVARTVTFLETGGGPVPVEREWRNPRYDGELARAEAR